MSELFDNQEVAEAVTRQPGSEQRIVSIDEALSQHLSQTYWDWRALFDRDPQASPLQHADFVLAELATERMPSRLNAVLVCDDQSGGLCTNRRAAPSPHGDKSNTRQNGKEADPAFSESQSGDGKSMGILVPKTVRTNHVGGLGPSWTLHGLRLAGGRFLSDRESPGQQVRMLQAAAQYCSQVGADFLLIEDLDEKHPLYEAVRNDSVHGCRLFTSRDFQPRRYIDFPPTEAEYWKTFTSLSLRKHRAKVRKAGSTRLERVTEIGQIAEFLRAAHDISKQSWQSHQFGMRIRDDEAELRRFSTLAQHGLLRSYVWWVEDQPAAFAVCNQHRGCLRYEETAFCGQFRHISAGVTMLHLIVEDLFHHNPPRYVDFGGGDAEYKQHFANRESRSGTIWLVPPTWRAGWSLSYLNACRRIRTGFRTLVKRSGWGTTARQWIRSRGRPMNPSDDAEDASQTPNTAQST